MNPYLYIASIPIAILFGILFSYFANNDKIHKLLGAINNNAGNIVSVGVV